MLAATATPAALPWRQAFRSLPPSSLCSSRPYNPYLLKPSSHPCSSTSSISHRSPPSANHSSTAFCDSQSSASNCSSSSCGSPSSTSHRSPTISSSSPSSSSPLRSAWYGSASSKRIHLLGYWWSGCSQLGSSLGRRGLSANRGGFLG